MMKLEPSCCERGINQGVLCTYCYADNIAFAAQWDDLMVDSTLVDALRASADAVEVLNAANR
jgi:hypothetical protein